MNKLLDAWFTEEILAHETSLVRYLARRWPWREDVHDLRQETYLRVYEAAGKERPRSGRAFLFTTARHLLADRRRRRAVVSIEAGWDTDALDILVDEVSPERSLGAHEELRLLAHTFDLLPPRCRAVIWLRKVEGLSQKQIAARLGIGESMVEKHIAKAMRRLADALFGSETPVEERRAPVSMAKERKQLEQHTN